MARVVSWLTIVALVVGGIVWWQTGAQAASGVELDVSAPSCERTRVERDGRAVVNRRMRCTYRLVVRNGSERRVRIGGIDTGSLGAGGTDVVQLDEDASDTEFGVRIEEGESARRDIVVVFRDDGSSPAGPLEIDDLTVRGSLFVRPFTVTASEPLRFRVPPRIAS